MTDEKDTDEKRSPTFAEGMAILAFFVLLFLAMPWIIQWGFVYLDWVGGFF